MLEVSNGQTTDRPRGRIVARRCRCVDDRFCWNGIGSRQGNGNGPNREREHRKHAIAGDGERHGDDVGQRQRHVVNPANSPVLIRDVDAQGAKELWQENTSTTIVEGDETVVLFNSVDADVPAGKALVIEHINVYYRNPQTPTAGPTTLVLEGTQFGASPDNNDLEYLVAQQFGNGFIADQATKFYVPPGGSFRFHVSRSIEQPGFALATVRLTGYLVNYP